VNEGEGMITSIAFRTKARTIDHLGREQIADCPTAISELWKNAYDAYARTVSLNIFNGKVPVASILDDGHGMSRSDFEAKWLVVGTESKYGPSESTPMNTKGLKRRPKQGQKGIGRLSSAYLGPLLLLVSKRDETDFVASLIDWRLFENPFIYLNDLEIPVVEFNTREELWALLPELFDRLMSNIWGDSNDAQRRERLEIAWSEFEKHEQRTGTPSTRAAIEQALLQDTFSERHLADWPVWKGESTSGTAMLVAHISFDLLSQLQDYTLENGIESEAIKQARDKIHQTLVNFTDPFISTKELEEDVWAVSDFSYSATAWNGILPRTIISSEKVFNYESLQALEHIIEGSVDQNGSFVGKVKAFGEWLPEDILIQPPTPAPKRVDSKVGPFHLRIGTFEQLLSSSTIEASKHAQLSDNVEKYGGFMVFRDGLRVMPYGRVDNDFFEIEQRRSTHAGREFWSNRRIFGRVALKRSENLNLRDKAGREGLIDNKAAKVFRDLVKNILAAAARRYFGTDSDIRKAKLPEIKALHGQRKAEEEQKKLRAKNRREFRTRLEQNIPILEKIYQRVENLAHAARGQEDFRSEEDLLEVRKQLSSLRAERNELSLGSAPKTLGSLESKYADFKAKSSATAELISQLSHSLTVALDRARPKSSKEAAASELNRNAAYIHNRIRRWSTAIKEMYAKELDRLNQIVNEKNKQYHSEALPLIAKMDESKLSASTVLDALESIRDRLDAENAQLFEGYISTLQSLRDSIDLNLLVNRAVEESDDLRDEITRLNSLAQLGITVEVVGHEIDGLEEAVDRSISRLPVDVRSHEAIQSMVAAHQALVDKLRFLSPLKLSGERTKIWITGKKISDYITLFLDRIIEARKIQVQYSTEFLDFSVYEQEARILPVFINLLNNSCYWVSQNEPGNRVVKLHAVGPTVMISDNGPGVPPEDSGRLFTLFFTRKHRSGRGVGLYLCRANLAAGGHTIEYIDDQSKKILPGANFLIKFKGTNND
jgi:signal transduction histidine kinase